ncbi:MAG: type II secretion system GspH family protein [Planctomycetaceae bacterium]|jgi:prepilin-type N-terminal cleavage/methylation domain-containing protein|nr:type II secretion system GspH family protein [Planctomycetaceae bacterium]
MDTSVNNGKKITIEADREAGRQVRCNGTLPAGASRPMDTSEQRERVIEAEGILPAGASRLRCSGTLPAFTLIELLIVIALLGMVAMIVIPNITGKRADVNEPIIQSELAEIQRAFFRLQSDSVPTSDDYQTVAKYGVAVLIKEYGGNIGAEWDNDRSRGWRGPYLSSEGERNIDPAGIGQPTGGVPVPVILGPGGDHDSKSDPYYRILASDENNIILQPVPPDSLRIDQLWLVYPYWGDDSAMPNKIPGPSEEIRKYYRKLLVEVEEVEDAEET